MAERKVEIHRQTKETDIKLVLDLDGKGDATVNTGIPFMDHMFVAFARHGFFDIQIEATGDLQVDYHHLVEDLGLVLGQAIKKAVGDKRGINRYGSFLLPMMMHWLRWLWIYVIGRSLFIMYRLNVILLGILMFSLFKNFFKHWQMKQEQMFMSIYSMEKSLIT